MVSNKYKVIKAWMIKHHDELRVYECGRTKEMAIDALLCGYSFKDWNEAKKSGYTVVKVEIKEVLK